MWGHCWYHPATFWEGRSSAFSISHPWYVLGHSTLYPNGCLGDLLESFRCCSFLFRRQTNRTADAIQTCPHQYAGCTACRQALDGMNLNIKTILLCMMWLETGANSKGSPAWGSWESPFGLSAHSSDSFFKFLFNLQHSTQEPLCIPGKLLLSLKEVGSFFAAPWVRKRKKKAFCFPLSQMY